MNWHKHKRILVGVSGGIAAYKSPVLVRRLIELGCEVRVVMTRAATEFITPLTLQAVSGHPVHQHLLDAEAESGMGHIELARWAEQVVIAPASANLIAKLAHGRADDLLSTLALATESEVVVAPAMNRRMWAHPATQRNLETLAQRGVRVIGPDTGDQACGESGAGRMTEPEEIAEEIASAGHPRLLDDVHVLITAGPTWEAMDPVRGITNHSSGKMGYVTRSVTLKRRCSSAAKQFILGYFWRLNTPLSSQFTITYNSSLPSPYYYWPGNPVEYAAGVAGLFMAQ